MHYREMGKTGVQVSGLGFGAMRLPLIEGTDGEIDEQEAIAMIRTSIDNGVNYLDTAYPYHGGKSELLCAKAMKDGYREKVHIATKLPSWEIQTYEDMEKFLEEQLAKLEVETIDFYLLHAMTVDRWETYKRVDYKKFLLKARDEGKIRYLGFSFHDGLDLFKDVIDDFAWDFCQIQLNYLDENYQAGLEGMRYAAERGIGVIVMEPLRGGMLSKDDIPEELGKIWNKSDRKRTPAQWALRYVWDYPEVNLVLSGMSTMDQVRENLKTAEDALPGALSGDEKALIDEARDFYRSRIRVNCTNCQYCMPCPTGVNIPELFWGYNHDAMFDDFDKGKFWTTDFVKPEARAHNCVECGECEGKCPQGISIIDHLKKITALYGRGE